MSDTTLTVVSDKKNNYAPSTSKATRNDEEQSQDEMALLMQKFWKFVKKFRKVPYKPNTSNNVSNESPHTTIITCDITESAVREIWSNANNK